MKAISSLGVGSPKVGYKEKKKEVDAKLSIPGLYLLIKCLASIGQLRFLVLCKYHISAYSFRRNFFSFESGKCVIFHIVSALWQFFTS